MSMYTAWFLKILIKTMQYSNKTFDASIIKSSIEDLIVSPKLVVATNSLPMLVVVQMFFMRFAEKDNTINDITKKAFRKITQHIESAK